MGEGCAEGGGEGGVGGEGEGLCCKEGRGEEGVEELLVVGAAECRLLLHQHCLMFSKENLIGYSQARVPDLNMGLLQVSRHGSTHLPAAAIART